MGSKRARVPGLPADFRVPRGWPTPTDRWLRENALWVPPAGWAPLPDTPPAPVGWRFWSPNKLWRVIAGQYYTGIAWMRRTANWLGVLWIVAAVAAAVVHGSLLFSGIAAIALLAGVVLEIRFRVRVHRITVALLAGFAVVADRERTARLTTAYQSYLRDAA